MSPTVYIETTVIGYLTSRPRPDPIVTGQMLQTRKWWDGSRHAFELFTSELVLEEASRGDPIAAAERLEVLAELPLVPIEDSAAQLTESLIAAPRYPQKLD